MYYQEIIPDGRLKRYVKCYYSYVSDSAVAFEDTVFPSGSMEIIFNLGSGHWQIASGNGQTTDSIAFQNTPPIELWGQITQPLPIRSVGRNTMLGIRFLPHGAALFLNEEASGFNNQVVDYRDIAGNKATILHGRLLETKTQHEQIALIDAFLLDNFGRPKKGFDKLSMVDDVMRELRRPEVEDNIENIAARYGISARYLQKLFLQYTGLTPKLYSKINRFQHSLRLVTKKEASLTSIAYDSGYFDQSHFIREFKAFTGFTPSGYALETSPITGAFAEH
jgi:AraC-like DNA-binding protein